MSNAFTIKVPNAKKRNWLIAAGRGKSQSFGDKRNRRRAQKERQVERAAEG